MGASLSQPLTEKISSDEANDKLKSGASSMQGWRDTQEDAHNCALDFDVNTSLFAVYDGHGGGEVAQFCSQNLPQYIKDTEAYKNGNIENALIDAFLGLDATIVTPKILAKLMKIANRKLWNKDIHDQYGSEEEGKNDSDKYFGTSESSYAADAVKCAVSSSSSECPKVESSSVSQSSKGVEENELSKAPESLSQVADPSNNVKEVLNAESEKVVSKHNVDEKGDRPNQNGKVKTPLTESINEILEQDQENGEISKKVLESCSETSRNIKISWGMKNEQEDSDEIEDEDEDCYGPGYSSGCTACVALLRENQLFVANAGDCRCIVSRNGKAVEMSIDHKPEDKLECDRIIKAGGTVRRINEDLNLSRAIGDHRYKKRKELSDREQMVTALPDVRTLTINPGEDEFMVLACDGIWNSMSSQQVVDFVKSRLQECPEKLSKICEEMFDHCLAPEPIDVEGSDNMTAIIIQFENNLCKRAAPSELE